VIRIGELRVGTLLLIGLLLVFALARIIGLGGFPLDDVEALHALGALPETPSFWEGLEGPTSTNALYQFLTNLFFQIFHSSNFAARVVPVLAGVLLLVAVVLLTPDQSMGKRVIWLVLLGASPILLTVARTAGGGSLATLFVLIIMLLLVRQRVDQSVGNGTGLMIAVGLAITTGLPILSALSGWMIAFGLSLILVRDREELWNSFLQRIKEPFLPWVALFISILIFAGFGSSLQGFRSLVISLEQWLAGWIQPSGYSALELAWTLLRSEPVLVIFGVLGAIQSWRVNAIQQRILTIWVISAGAFTLIYQGRTPGDLVWLVLPLSMLALEPLEALLTSIQNQDSKLEFFGLIGLLSAFTASGLLSLIAYGSGNVVTIDPNNPALVLVLFIALGLMGISVLVFFGIGWSWKLVFQSLGLMAFVLGLSQSVSALWRLNFSNQHDRVSELWTLSAPAPGLMRLIATLEQTALGYSGDANTLSIEVQGELSPSLQWALNGFEQLNPGQAFGEQAAPVILAPDFNAAANLPADYIGQSLGVRKLRAWDGMLPENMLGWILKRDASYMVEQWVLWVRIDIASFGEIGVGAEDLGEVVP
jgi:hypothetical protein